MRTGQIECIICVKDNTEPESQSDTSYFTGPNMAIYHNARLTGDVQLEAHIRDCRHAKKQFQENSPNGSFMQTNHMLYVLCQVIEQTVEMMIDSGASSSVVSSKMLSKMGMLDKLKKEVEGVVLGVGSAEVLGVLENVPCGLGAIKFRSSFSFQYDATSHLMLPPPANSNWFWFHC